MIGDKLRSLNLTVVTMAVMTGLSKETISRVRRNKQAATADTLVRLAVGLNVSMNWLLSEEMAQVEMSLAKFVTSAPAVLLSDTPTPILEVAK